MNLQVWRAKEGLDGVKWVAGSRFRVLGLGLRVQGSGFRVQELGSGFRIQGLGLKVLPVPSRASGSRSPLASTASKL